MEQKEHIVKRAELLRTFTDMKYSISAQQKIARLFENTKNSQEREDLAEKVLKLMEKMTEEEVLKNL